MSPPPVALVARTGASRLQIARYLRDGGYVVLECEDLAAPGEVAGAVIVDDQEPGDALRDGAEAWLRGGAVPRVVVVSSRPAGWKALALAHAGRLHVLAAPAFGWEIVDALRAGGRPDHERGGAA